MTKVRIPQKLREEVWVQSMGLTFQGSCKTPWCRNLMSVFDFHVAHKIAESKGGLTKLENLIPLCSRCNLSMGTKSYEEWLKYGNCKNAKFSISKLLCCADKEVKVSGTPVPKPTINID
jgi:5-methylcytosine-specific restriction endonuclease McrA